MGRSTTAQLIAKGKGENSYNNAGINSDGAWVDFFNAALSDLADDIELTDTLSISFVDGTREYNLPTHYHGIVELYDGNGTPVTQRRNYGSSLNTVKQGYWILNKGATQVIDLYRYMGAQTFTGLYIRYPAMLSATGINSEYPEVPSVGEMALPYYAISKALRNQNQVGMAQEMEQQYEAERKKIRNAAARARGG